MVFEVLLNAALFFLVYSLIGWALESGYASLTSQSFCNRGIATGPICPVYGFCSLVVLLFAHFVENLWLVFAFSIIVCSLVEWGTALCLKKAFGLQFWNYDTSFANLRGYLSLPSSLLWGILCILLVDVLHPALSSLLSGLPLLWKLLLTVILGIYLVSDLSFSFASLSSLNRRLAAIQKLDDTISQRHEHIHILLDTASSVLKDRRLSLMQNCTWLHRRLLHSYSGLRSFIYPNALESLKSYLLTSRDKKVSQ